MPHRAYQSQNIPVDALMAIADGGEAFKRRLEQFFDAKTASQSEQSIADKAKAGSAASLSTLLEEREAFNAHIEAHDKQVEKDARRLEKIKKDALSTKEQAEILSVEIGRQKIEADERETALNTRHDEQEAREKRQDSRDEEQDQREANQDIWDGLLTDRETKLNTSVRDLNERIDGFRVGA